jgi:hypothetical protein
MFADDTVSSFLLIIVTTSFKSALSYTYKWFQINQLVINVEKTDTVKFILTESSCCQLDMKFKDQIRSEANNKISWCTTL